MDVRIVDARPEHVPFIAWVMLTAHRSHLERGLWDFLIGDSEAECLRFLEALATTSRPHWSHHSIFIVAEVDGRPAAALCGYIDGELGTVTGSLTNAVQEASRMVGRTEEDTAAGWKRAGSIALVAPDHARDAWVVENVATLPEFRRKGRVDRLLAEMLDRGRRRGATVGDIGVLIGNDGAQRAYEKAGFKVISEKLHPDFEAVYKSPGIRSLRQSL